MKKQKIAVFAVIIALIANICACVHANAGFSIGYDSGGGQRIQSETNESDAPDYIRMETTRYKRDLYYKTFAGIVCEVDPDVPENYFCIVVEPKNRVQEARRIVDEEKRTFVRFYS